MALEEDVQALMESITDRRAAAVLIVKLVRATIAAEAAAELQAAVERGKEIRREAERVRKAEYRAHLSRHVPGTPRDTSGQSGTRPPLDPPDPVSSGDPIRSGSSPDPSKPDLEDLGSDEPAAPALMEFPVAGGKRAWGLTAALRDVQQQAYPDLDVMAEYRKALAWVVSNPARKKTAKGMAQFLRNWLETAQNGNGKRNAHNVTALPLTAPPARNFREEATQQAFAGYRAQMAKLQGGKP